MKKELSDFQAAFIAGCIVGAGSICLLLLLAIVFD